MKFITRLQRWIPLIIICVIWEFLAHISLRIQFLFASPYLIVKTFYLNLINGQLVINTVITGFEAIVGLVLGVLLGSIIGFVLLYNENISAISRPYIIAMSSIPVFGIAPMMIIWFGIGIIMKIALAFFSTVFVAIFQSYQGGKRVPVNAEKFFTLNKASKNDNFWKLVLPSSIDWIIQSLKLNTGLALLGAFIGEFIASDKGLGYIILKASGLYDIPYVLAAVICIILLATFLNFLVNLIELRKLKIVRSLSIKKFNYSS